MASGIAQKKRSMNPPMETILIKTISELSGAAKQILSFAKDKKIFLFYGELGAGKTTLIKEICRQLGVTEAGSSPTFAIVNEYNYLTPRSPHLAPPKRFAKARRGESQSEIHTRPNSSPLGRPGGVIYHLDLYRLKNESEIYDIGYEEYLFSGNYCLIEWPEKIEHLLITGFIKVLIEVKDMQRIISLSC